MEDNKSKSTNELKDLSPTFDLINQEVITKWEKVLLSDKSPRTKLISENTNIDDYCLSFASTYTVKNDSHRTRVKERFNFPDFEITLQKCLIFFCKLNNIEYKQGLNEILGPFLLLKVKMNSLSINHLFNLFSCFIDYFLANYYYEAEFFSFRSSSNLIALLLKYHEPRLYNLFKENKISPEMYSTNWLLTTFANKTPLEITYMLWDIMIEENNQLFIYFMLIGFLRYHQDKFFNSDGSSIPVFFSKTQISTKEELSEILKLAKIIRDNTPLSFGILVNELEIFKSWSSNLRELYEEYNPEQMLALPILPNELMSLININRKQIPCPNTKCKNFVMNIADDIENFESCPLCRNVDLINNNLNYTIIDLRIKNDSKSKELINNEGTLNIFNNNILTQDMINKSNVGEIMLQQIKKFGLENQHIILMTNLTENFDEFEYKFQEMQAKYEGNDDILHATIKELKKQIDEEKNKRNLSNETINNMKNQLKEYGIIRNILVTLIGKNCKYISYIYGGFRNIHDKFLKYNIPLNLHKPNCFLCNLNYKTLHNKKEASIKKIHKTKNYHINLMVRPTDIQRKNSEIEIPVSTVFDKVIEELPCNEMNQFFNDKSNKIFHCNLVWHNMYSINSKGTIIIFGTNIKIYKMNIKKGDKDVKGGIFFDLVEVINNEDIYDILRDNNVFNLYYKTGNKNNDLKIDTYSDRDGELFYSSIKEIVEKNGKGDAIIDK